MKHNLSLAQPYSKITDITRTSRERKSFCFLTQSHRDTNPHFHGDKDLWYIPMPPPVSLIEGEKGGGIPLLLILCGFVSLCDYFSPFSLPRFHEDRFHDDKSYLLKNIPRVQVCNLNPHVYTFEAAIAVLSFVIKLNSGFRLQT